MAYLSKKAVDVPAWWPASPECHQALREPAAWPWSRRIIYQINRSIKNICPPPGGPSLVTRDLSLLHKRLLPYPNGYPQGNVIQHLCNKKHPYGC